MNDIRYLNVDLEIDSSDDLTPIVKSFGDDVVVMFNGAWGNHNRAAFEISGSHASADNDIQYFCALVEGLDDLERKLWDQAYSKTFDLGFNSGEGNKSYSTELKQNTIERAAKVGAIIKVTIYPIKNG